MHNGIDFKAEEEAFEDPRVQTLELDSGSCNATAEEIRAELFAMELEIEESYAGVRAKQLLVKKRALLSQVAVMQAKLASLGRL